MKTRLFGMEIDMSRGLGDWLINAINFIEKHFESYGAEINENNPKLLYDWYDVLKAFENFHNRTSNTKLIREDIRYEHSDFDGYEDAINRIDGILSGQIYPFVVYDRNVYEKWKNVEAYLTDFAETKWHKNIEK